MLSFIRVVLGIVSPHSKRAVTKTGDNGIFKVGIKKRESDRWGHAFGGGAGISALSSFLLVSQFIRWFLFSTPKTFRCITFPGAQAMGPWNSRPDPSNSRPFLVRSHLLQVFLLQWQKLRRCVSPLTRLFVELLAWGWLLSSKDVAFRCLPSCSWSILALHGTVLREPQLPFLE